MRIQHNIMAMSAYRNYTNNVSAMKKNLEKLSSGYKINRAGDDAAGLAISEKMRAQITGLETAQKNAKDGISLVQTAEGALTEVHDMLNRMVELATQSANGTYDNTTDREQMQKELNQLRSEINRIADSSNFNGIKLLDGTMSLNDTNPVDVTNTTTAQGADKTVFAAASDVVGSIGATTAGASNKTILHTDGKEAAIGQFTIALDQVEVINPGAGKKAALTVTVGTAAATISAAASSVGMNGKTIATQMASGKGKFFVVKNDGSTAFASSSAAAKTAADAKGLIYTATNNNNGTVTYTLSGYTNATKTYAALANTTALANLAPDVADSLKNAAGKDLNFNVAVATKANGGALTDNRQNYGTIGVKNSAVKQAGTFGDAAIGFDITKLKDGDKITIGAGDEAKTLYINLKGSDSLVKVGNKVTEGSGTSATQKTIASSDVLDLSAFASSGAVTAGNKLAAMNKVAAAFNDQNGIYVGVNASGGKLTLSEKTNASGTSAAGSAVREAMGEKDTFKKLIQVGHASVQKGDNATAKSTVTVDNPDSIYEGNTLELTINGKATKFTFTKDAAKLNATGSAVPANTKYVDLNASKGVVDALKTAISAVAGTSVTTTLATNGKDIILNVTGTATTVAAPVASATSAIKWTGNAGLKLQIGDTADSFNQLKVNINDMHTKALNIAEGDISIADQESAAKAIDAIKKAINTVSDVRGTLGATQNRLDHTINNLSVMTENIQDAESTIRDTDVAAEMMAYTKNNILIQSAQAMLAQANQVPQGVLQLLQ